MEFCSRGVCFLDLSAPSPTGTCHLVLTSVLLISFADQDTRRREKPYSLSSCQHIPCRRCQYDVYQQQTLKHFSSLLQPCWQRRLNKLRGSPWVLPRKSLLPKSHQSKQHVPAGKHGANFPYSNMFGMLQVFLPSLKPELLQMEFCPSTAGW